MRLHSIGRVATTHDPVYQKLMSERSWYAVKITGFVVSPLNLVIATLQIFAASVADCAAMGAEWAGAAETLQKGTRKPP